MSIGSFMLLVIAFLIYSMTGVFVKSASLEDFLSSAYLLRLFWAVLALGIYAILWQICLKKVPLSQAYLFKSMTVLFGLVFAYTFFNEEISLMNIVGALFIIMGIIVNSRQIIST